MQAPLKPKATDQLQSPSQRQQKFHTFLMNKSAQYRSFFFSVEGGGPESVNTLIHCFYTSQSQKRSTDCFLISHISLSLFLLASEKARESEPWEQTSLPALCVNLTSCKPGRFELDLPEPGGVRNNGCCQVNWENQCHFLTSTENKSFWTSSWLYHFCPSGSVNRPGLLVH